MTAFWLLFTKDLRLLLRARATLVGTFGFALLLAVVASFAFLDLGYGEQDLKILTPGIVWLIFLFSGVIGLNHTFGVEQENEAMNGLLLMPIAPSAVFCAKALSNFLFLMGVQLFVLIVHGLLFGVDLFGVLPELVLITVLAGIGYIAFGTLLSAISVCARGRELLLPLILFPLLLPLIAGAVFLSRELLLRGEIAFESFWFTLLCGYDIIALILSLILFEHTVRN